MLDLYSRAVVGSRAVLQESGALAEQLMAETAAKQGIPTGQNV